MVERILTAAREVLLEHGHHAASTNRIAQAADISPGSLYQYFPDKEAIVAAVVEQYSDELSTRITAAFTDHLSEQGESLVRSSVEALLDALVDNAALLRLVVNGLPGEQGAAKLEALEQRSSELVAVYLSTQRNLRPGLEPSVAAWVLVRLVEQLTVRYVLDQPPVTRDLFVSELVQLITGYVGVDS